MESAQLRNILEACLLVAGRPMSVAQLDALFEGDESRPDKGAIREALAALGADYEGRGIELVEVAGGYRLQTRRTMEHWVARLFAERAPRYSRALLETLVLIAYRQPITRGEIEEVRGVAVSSNIVRTLQERRWVREIGHKDVPGKPALLGTTSEFLDYFNLKRLDQLPSLGELKDLDGMEALLAAELGGADEPNGPAAGRTPDGVVSESVEERFSDGEAEAVMVGETTEAPLDRRAEGGVPGGEPEELSDRSAGEPAGTRAEAESVGGGVDASAPARSADDALVGPPAPARDRSGDLSMSALAERFAPSAAAEVAPEEGDARPDEADGTRGPSAGSANEERENAADGVENDPAGEGAGNPPGGAQARMLAAVDEFAAEHRREIAARDEFERRMSGPPERDDEVP